MNAKKLAPVLISIFFVASMLFVGCSKDNPTAPMGSTENVTEIHQISDDSGMNHALVEITAPTSEIIDAIVQNLKVSPVQENESVDECEIIYAEPETQGNAVNSTEATVFEPWVIIKILSMMPTNNTTSLALEVGEMANLSNESGNNIRTVYISLPIPSTRKVKFTPSFPIANIRVWYDYVLNSEPLYYSNLSLVWPFSRTFSVCNRPSNWFIAGYEIRLGNVRHQILSCP